MTLDRTVQLTFVGMSSIVELTLTANLNSTYAQKGNNVTSVSICKRKRNESNLVPTLQLAGQRTPLP